MSNVTHILSQIESGDPSAADQLLTLVYNESRKLAAVRMAQQSPGHTLQPTALMHEAYIQLVDGHQNRSWDHRGHFFAAAAEAMRQIRVVYAALKNGQINGINPTLNVRRRFSAEFLAESERAGSDLKAARSQMPAFNF